MRLDALRLAASFALTAMVLWVSCSLFVATMPMLMMPMTGHMLHADLVDVTWHMTGIGFLIGLVAWAAWAGVTGWLIAWIYNRLGGSAEP